MSERVRTLFGRVGRALQALAGKEPPERRKLDELEERNAYLAGRLRAAYLTDIAVPLGDLVPAMRTDDALTDAQFVAYEDADPPGVLTEAGLAKVRKDYDRDRFLALCKTEKVGGYWDHSAWVIECLLLTLDWERANGTAWWQTKKDSA